MKLAVSWSFSHIEPIHPISKIIETTANFYGCQPADIRGSARHKTVAEARHVAAYLSRTLTRASYPEIGRRFDKNHTTIMHACAKVEAQHDVLERAYFIANEMRSAGERCNA